MTIYDRPTKSLMADWSKKHLTPAQAFSKGSAVRWFQENYPKIKPNTVAMHVEAMSINNLNRKHHPSVRPGSGHDLFFKLGSDQFRLWNPDTDPAPLYRNDIEKLSTSDAELLNVEVDPMVEADDDAKSEAAQTFAYERDLKNYLAKNLSSIEPGLRVYDEEGISGVEFPVGGRFIDILAVDRDGNYVVFELKVSRGYDRVIGQLLRYMSWIEQNLASSKHVRGFIVASEITGDLKLAASRIPDVKLVEYEISFRLRRV